MSSQLVPLLVLVLEHELVRGGGELRRLVGHALRALLQLGQLVAALQHQLVRPRNLQCAETRASQVMALFFRTPSDLLAQMLYSTSKLEIS